MSSIEYSPNQVYKYARVNIKPMSAILHTGAQVILIKLSTVRTQRNWDTLGEATCSRGKQRNSRLCWSGVRGNGIVFKDVRVQRLFQQVPGSASSSTPVEPDNITVTDVANIPTSPTYLYEKMAKQFFLKTANSSLSQNIIIEDEQSGEFRTDSKIELEGKTVQWISVLADPALQDCPILLYLANFYLANRKTDIPIIEALCSNVTLLKRRRTW